MSAEQSLEAEFLCDGVVTTHFSYSRLFEKLAIARCKPVILMALARLNGEEGDVTPTALLVFGSDLDINVFNGGSSL